ncbi:MAG: T9SS C-terminal target domain-containing protein, partial [Bacteroidetes bacterium]
IDDFECQRNVNYGAGADRLKVVLNPDVSQGNASTQVGEYTDPLDEWSALVLDYGQDIDLSVRNQFEIKIWAPAVVPLLFKLEGGSSPAREIFTEVQSANEWNTYTVDFSPYAGESHTRVAIFFNAGQLPAQEDVYYLDDMRWRRAGFTGCVLDYESELTTITAFQYFANGSLEGNLEFSVEDNPSPDAVNSSSKVGKFVKAGDALPFAGIYTDLEAPIDFKGNKTVKVKVLMDHIGNFAVKLEGSQTGAPAIEIPVPNTKTDEWEELTFDFSEAADDARYMRLTLFFDLGIDATGVDVTSYFDELVIGDGMCGAVGLFDTRPVRSLEIYPNPFSQNLVLEQAEEIQSLKVYNAMGQQVKQFKLQRQAQHVLELSDLKPGMYVIAAYGRNGLLANRKVLKQ